MDDLTANGLALQLRTLISIYNRYDTSESSKTIINGYMEHHRRLCRRLDCPVKYPARRSVIIQKKISAIAKTKLKKFDMQ